MGIQRDYQQALKQYSVYTKPLKKAAANEGLFPLHPGDHKKPTSRS